MKKIFSIIISVMFFFNSLYIPSFAVTYTDPSSGAFINDLYHKAIYYFIFQASQGTALIQGDFAKILENDATYKELCEKGAVSFDETTGNVSLSEEMQEYLLQYLKGKYLDSTGEAVQGMVTKYADGYKFRPFKFTYYNNNTPNNEVLPSKIWNYSDGFYFKYPVMAVVHDNLPPGSFIVDNNVVTHAGTLSGFDLYYYDGSVKFISIIRDTLNTII